ncbi:MAG: DegV family protein [Lachnospiraceae bacterium]|nr:DegV family protein [Lachnospiraceae bacterium]
MPNFKLVTDTTADLPKHYLQEHDLGCMFVTYTIDGTNYSDGHEMDDREFYERMRAGIMPTTSQVNPEEAKAYFTEYLKESREILYLAFSSGLSGTYNSARIAAEEIMEANPDCKIRVVDTRCASLGEGLLVHKAVQLREEGKSMEETADWVEAHVQNLVHVFTVDDLNHLYRGGRVSRTTAVIGTIAGIKPILHVDEEGHLIPVSKVRGRRKSLHALVDYMEAHVGSYAGENDIVFISHGDALEDAEAVRDEIRERFGIQNFMIHTIGPTIGTHAGPGTIALFFMGEKR